MLKVKPDMMIRDLCKMFKYCINRGRFVSVDASIKSDAKTGASERKRPFKLTNEQASEQKG